MRKADVAWALSAAAERAAVGSASNQEHCEQGLQIGIEWTQREHCVCAQGCVRRAKNPACRPTGQGRALGLCQDGTHLGLKTSVFTGKAPEMSAWMLFPFSTHLQTKTAPKTKELSQ